MAFRAYLRSELSVLVRIIQGSEMIVSVTGNKNIGILVADFFVQAVDPEIDEVV
jgi:hypothetical protein